jgi:hypothetical protein
MSSSQILNLFSPRRNIFIGMKKCIFVCWTESRFSACHAVLETHWP